MITTIYATPDNPTGLRDESEFEKREGGFENDNEHTTWVEYWDGETLVHRSAHIRLKKSVFAEAAVGGVG